MNVTWLQLVAAFFIAFILAHMTTKYFERFERFPSPLVSPGPELPGWVQGRDFIPYRARPTAPPGPLVPEAVDVDGKVRETVPPGPMQTVPPTAGPITVAPSTTPTSLPYAMSDDDYTSFLGPSSMQG